MLKWRSGVNMMTGIEPSVDFPFHISVEVNMDSISGDVDIYNGKISVETPNLEGFSLTISWNGKSMEKVKEEAEDRAEWIKGIFLDLMRLKIGDDLFDEYMETKIGQVVPFKESMPQPKLRRR